MGRMERGLPCPYHSPARSETPGQAFTLQASLEKEKKSKIMRDGCKIIARCNRCLCRGHVDARQLHTLFVAGPRWSHTAQTLPARTIRTRFAQGAEGLEGASQASLASQLPN